MIVRYEQNYSGLYHDYKFVFYFNSQIGVIDSNFKILSISPMSQGIETENSYVVSIFPGNFSITIDDFEGNNYKMFQKFLSNYRFEWPCNYREVFHVELYIDGEKKFRGLIDSIEHDANSEEITVKFQDGISLYKRFTLANPRILKFLADNGLLYRKTFYLNASQPCYAYGFKTTSYDPTVLGWYFYDMDQAEMAVPLRKWYETMFKFFDLDLPVNFAIDWKFMDLNEPLSSAATFEEIYIRRIHSDVIGRYVVFDNRAPRRIAYDETTNYHREQDWERVFNDESYEVWYYKFKGNPSYNTSLVINNGMAGSTVGDQLKTISKNFFCYYGFQKGEEMFVRHKLYAQDKIKLEDIATMTQLARIDKADGIRIEDYHDTSNYALRGIFAVNNKQYDHIDYGIPLNSFKTLYGRYFNMVYYRNGREKEVYYAYDPLLDLKEVVQELLAELEWRSFNVYRSQYEITVNRVDIPYNAVYEIEHPNFEGIVRPIAIEHNYETEETRITAIDIDL